MEGIMLSARICGDSKSGVKGDFFYRLSGILLGRLGGEADDEGDTTLVTSIDRDMDAVVSGFGQFQVLDIDDEVPGQNAGIAIEVDFGGYIDIGHDRLAVFIYEVDADGMLAFLDTVEDDSECDGAMGVNSGEFGGYDGVEGAEEVEFAAVICGGIAEGGYLDIHGFGLTGWWVLGVVTCTWLRG
jgi:hypothetical protein